MCSIHLGADYVFAWPGAEIAVMGAEGAANIIFAKEIEQGENAEAKRKEYIHQYEEIMMNPYMAAESGYIHDIIVPGETRKRVMEAFRALEQKTEQRIPKKHGNIPL